MHKILTSYKVYYFVLFWHDTQPTPIFGSMAQRKSMLSSNSKSKAIVSLMNPSYTIPPPYMDPPYKELWGSNGQEPVPYRGGGDPEKKPAGFLRIFCPTTIWV